MGCDREHWCSHASVQDDGMLWRPEVFEFEEPADGLHTDLLDRTRRHEPIYRAGRWWPGELRISFWGHDRDRVLAATVDRFRRES